MTRRLGQRMKDLRTARKLTQEAAAERAKLEAKHWQDLENNRRTNPTLATLLAVARALDVQVADLFGRD